MGEGEPATQTGPQIILSSTLQTSLLQPQRLLINKRNITWNANMKNFKLKNEFTGLHLFYKLKWMHYLLTCSTQ